MALSQISKLLFGDEKTVLNMPASMIQTGKAFVPVESKHKGYLIQVKKQVVIVSYRNPWRTISGLPSIYRFVGRLSELRQVDDTILVPGIVTLKPMEKIFLSIWFGLLLFFLAVSFAQAAWLAGRFMFFSGTVPTDDLATIGFMLGSGVLVAVFGVVALTIERLLSKGQRHRLIAFCVHPGNKFTDDIG